MVLFAFLFPLAVYLLLLGLVNRLPRPFLVRGSWDFLGLFFGLSGFLLLGLPAILNGLYQERRLAWVVGGTDALWGLGDDSWFFWIAIWCVYYPAVLTAAGFLFRRRLSTTAIYNSTRGEWESCLRKALDSRGIGVVAQDERGSLLFRENEPGVRAIRFALQVDEFPLLRHITLTWTPAGSPLRDELEAALQAEFAALEVRPNPANAWFLGASVCLFGVTFFGAAMFFVGYVQRLVQR